MSLMKSKLAGLCVAFGLLLFGASPPALAALVTYDFSVICCSDPVGPQGVKVDGTFTYDSQIVPSGGGIVAQTGLFSDFSFDLRPLADAYPAYANQPFNKVFDETTANTGTLAFDAAGSLTRALFGSNCTANSCIDTGGNWTLSLLFGPDDVVTAGAFSLAPGASALNTSRVVTGELVSISNPVPEPATLALVALAIAGLGLSRRGKA